MILSLVSNTGNAVVANPLAHLDLSKEISNLLYDESRKTYRAFSQSHRAHVAVKRLRIKSIEPQEAAEVNFL